MILNAFDGKMTMKIADRFFSVQFSNAAQKQRETDVFQIPNSVQEYRTLPAWQRGIELVQLVSRIVGDTASKNHNHCLIKLQKAVLDVPTFIAQGRAAGGDSHFHYMLENTKRSLAAVDTQTFLAHQMDSICLEDRRQIEVLIIEMQHLIHQLQRNLKR